MTERESTVYSSPGRKFDEGKARYELIPPEPFEALAILYTNGAAKYGDRNWEKGMSMVRLFGAMMRHAWKWLRGETWDTDPQTGAVTHHMIQVAWNAFAIYTLSVRDMSQFDDRPLSKGQTPDPPTQSDGKRIAWSSLSATDKAIVKTVLPQDELKEVYEGYPG